MAFLSTRLGPPDRAQDEAEDDCGTAIAVAPLGQLSANVFRTVPKAVGNEGAVPASRCSPAKRRSMAAKIAN